MVGYHCRRRIWSVFGLNLTRRQFHASTYAKLSESGDSQTTPVSGKSWYSAKRQAVVLLSGGLDSATVLALATRKMGFVCHTLAFDYGQRHKCELQAAQHVSQSLGVKDHRVVNIDMRVFGGSALTSDHIEVPKDREEYKLSREIPSTYVPARNTIFLSYALAFAESIGALDIFIGANQIDYSGYPDCRQLYFDAFEKMARLGTRSGIEGDEVKIHTPILKMTKVEIIQTGLVYDVDYSLTHSCYDPQQDNRPCGHCDSCLIRQKAFMTLGFKQDPALDRFPSAQ
mmetsp:Transcript_2988/g.5271  ORF Transcript_2988/g.5271 Transcript_2988/m.5271 type:complete len:285 (+) Transcript_2988:43-897(+)